MIARVFPRLTEATPTDSMAFIGSPPLFFEREVSEVHISVSWTDDLPDVDRLCLQWEKVAPVRVGGPACGDPGGEFTPGRYLRPGYVITSRGCPNRCWFCHAWKREGNVVRELEVKDGWNVLDSNLLACSEGHIRKVFEMLERQPARAQFTGGLEAARLKPWHVDLLWRLRPEQMFFAYDTPDDYEPLVAAGQLLRRADFTRSHLRCYVLIGHPKDTLAEAENRLMQTWDAGFLPAAMLWQGDHRNESQEWRDLQRHWMRPAITKKHVRELVTAGWKEG